MVVADIVRELACGGARCPCVQTPKQGRGLTHCPAHEDPTPSLNVDPGKNGRPLVRCHAGCEQKRVLEALRAKGLWKTKGGRGSSSPRNHWDTGTVPRADGLTLAAYAAAKCLPEDFLRGLGLSDIHVGGRPALRIPYRTVEGAEAAVRLRLALEGGFRWRSGSRLIPYGLEQLAAARSAGSVVLVEGESDAQTLWHHGISALGLPGAATWKEDWAKYLDGIARLYVVREPDHGGDTLAAKIAISSVRERVSFVCFAAGVKDPSALHLANPDGFRAAWDAMVRDAVPWSQEHGAAQEREAIEAFRLARGLLDDPTLLERMQDAMTAGGYAGDATAPALVYIALTSRLLERPINVAVVAPSAAGKNATVDAALRLVPEEAVHRQKAGSERALIYGDEDYKHRVVYFTEVDSIPDEGPAASAVRSLAEDNAMEYDVTERDPETGKHTVRRIVKPGPTGLITTSTRSLKEQLGTRVLELPVPDDKAQTEKVIAAHAARVSGDDRAPVDRTPFLALQRWLALAGERRVIVPFARVLGRLIPPAAVRMRRDARQLFSCIQVVAFLHQRQRERTATGAVIATLDDYAIARELLAPIFDTIVAQGVTPAIRQTIEAMKAGEEVSEADLAERLALSKNAVSYRVRRAVDEGWLNNLETRRGCKARLVHGTPLPERVSALPIPDRLRKLSQCPNGSREARTPPPPSGGNGAADREEFDL